MTPDTKGAEAPAPVLPGRRLTPSQARALAKAVVAGRVHIATGFGGDLDAGAARAHPMFDLRRPIEALLRLGLLAPGLGANAYEATPEGRDRHAAIRAGAESLRPEAEGADAWAEPAGRLF